MTDASTYWQRRKAQIAAAGFVEPLASFIEVDYEGRCTFSYAMQCGALKSVLEHAIELVGDANRAQSAKARQECVRAAFHWMQAQRERHAEIHRLWSDHLEALKAAIGGAS